jgi:glycosyltransferase involved in cell wall biosynthesis
MMRVAYLVSEYPAPSHTFIRREIVGLRERGLAIKIHSVRRPDDKQLYSDQDRLSRNETFYILPVRWWRYIAAHLLSFAKHPVRYVELFCFATRHRASGLKSMLWSVFHFVEAIVLASELKAAAIQHLHNHFANSGATVGLLAAKFAGIPWSLTLHGISETDYPAGVMLGEKIKAAKFVACASYFIRAQAMRVVTPSHWTKLVIVRCAVDLAALPRRRPPSVGTPRTVVAVGRLSPEKAFHGLLQAFARLRSQGINARLVIVGGGSGLSEIKESIDALSLANDVVLRGGLSEADTLQEIANADVLALSSLMEGLPVVLIEALAMGVPTVASHIAGIPELIVNNCTGLLFRPTDWEDLAEKIASLLLDDDLGHRLAESGRQLIEAEFTVQHSAELMHGMLLAGQLHPRPN